MTEEERNSIRQFDAKVRRLITGYEALKRENQSLRDELVLKTDTLSSLRAEVEQLRSDYDNLKMARLISVSDRDVKDAKQRISNMVREVNKCINILSAGGDE